LVDQQTNKSTTVWNFVSPIIIIIAAAASHKRSHTLEGVESTRADDGEQKRQEKTILFVSLRRRHISTMNGWLEGSKGKARG